MRVSLFGLNKNHQHQTCEKINTDSPAVPIHSFFLLSQFNNVVFNIYVYIRISIKKTFSKKQKKNSLVNFLLSACLREAWGSFCVFFWGLQNKTATKHSHKQQLNTKYYSQKVMSFVFIITIITIIIIII